MKAEVRMVTGTTFLGKADSNHWLAMDGDPAFGGGGAAATPMELVLMALGGCTAMDVASIMRKKRAPLEGFRLELEATRAADHPKVFTDVRLVYYCRGEGLRPADVEEAVRLSREKYCPVAAMLAPACRLTYEVKLEP